MLLNKASNVVKQRAVRSALSSTSTITSKIPSTIKQSTASFTTIPNTFTNTRCVSQLNHYNRQINNKNLNHLKNHNKRSFTSETTPQQPQQPPQPPQQPIKPSQQPTESVPQQELTLEERVARAAATKNEIVWNRANQQPVPVGNHAANNNINKNMVNKNVSKNGEGTPTHLPPTATNPVFMVPEAGGNMATRAHYLDRRDNIHSYERGQFQTLTGKQLEEKNTGWLYYLVAIGFASLGMSFVAVPLYQAFCQMTGSGGQIRRDQQIDELNRYMQRTHAMGDVTLRPIQVTFQATTDTNLPWAFYPCQRDITLRIGETALAFFRARNNGTKPIIGVSTYNVLPPQAGLYFNKIQCFCFDEQRLRAGEEIDMPVFFFLDPAMADDWRMDNVDQVTLCYTFFEVQEDEVDAAIQGLNEVRSANNERLMQSTIGQQALGVVGGGIDNNVENNQAKEPDSVVYDKDTNTTITTNGQTKTYTTTMTVNVVVPNENNNKNNKNLSTDGKDDDGEGLICPIIPPTAMHNPSGISLLQSTQPRIVSDEEAKLNQQRATGSGI